MTDCVFDPAEACHLMEPVREIIGNRWKFSILQYLMNGPQTLQVLKQSIRYVSYRVLLETLTDLENQGVLTSELRGRAHLDVEYTLTDKGYSLEPVFASMRQWSHGDL